MDDWYEDGRPHVQNGRAVASGPAGTIHLSFRSGSRGSGASASAAFEYVSRSGQFEHRELDEALHVESDHMPAWATDAPEEYWDAADLFERANGRLLELEDKVALARAFAHEFTDAEQLPYTLAVHAGRDASGAEHNPHAHILISERKNDGIDRDRTQWFRRANSADPARGGAPKTRSLHGQPWLERARSRWAALTNELLASRERPERVDHRSYARQGIAREPGRQFRPRRCAPARERPSTRSGDAIRRRRRTACPIGRHRVVTPDGARRVRERKRAPVSSRSAALRWGEAFERILFARLMDPAAHNQREEVPTLRAFAPRFMKGHSRANRQKPSWIASKEMILRVHLLPALGHKRLDTIKSEDVQRLEGSPEAKAPKTVNNVLAVLSVMLKKAVEWEVIERMPCTVKLLPVPKGSTKFHDFDEFEKLVEAARLLDPRTHLVVLLGGEAGLRCGEMMALEWSDVDLVKRQLTIQRPDWNGHVTTPKGGRPRHVPLTRRLAAALGEHRHLRSKRVLCQDDAKPFTRQIVQTRVKRAARSRSSQVTRISR